MDDTLKRKLIDAVEAGLAYDRLMRRNAEREEPAFEKLDELYKKWRLKSLVAIEAVAQETQGHSRTGP